MFPPIFSKNRLTKFLACQESRFTVVERVTTQSEGVSEEEEDRGGQRGYSGAKSISSSHSTAILVWESGLLMAFIALVYYYIEEERPSKEGTSNFEAQPRDCLVGDVIV
jgi:hypothetical protein